MLPSLLVLLDSLLLPFAISAPVAETSHGVQVRDVDVGWPYGLEKIRGVNIGGVSDA